MTDKELLEDAAKAAGLKVEWREWVTSRVAEFAMTKHIKHEGFWVDGQLWNPLTDDGDALRLAVKLGINIPTRWEHEKMERCGLDVYAATRRAIVRAAAEIGKEMK